jgi:hypothetical protein
MTKKMFITHVNPIPGIVLLLTMFVMAYLYANWQFFFGGLIMFMIMIFTTIIRCIEVTKHVCNHEGENNEND